MCFDIDYSMIGRKYSAFTHTHAYSKPTRPQSLNHLYVNTEPIRCFKPPNKPPSDRLATSQLSSTHYFVITVTSCAAGPRRGLQMPDAVLPAFKQTRSVTPAPTGANTETQRLKTFPDKTDNRRKTHLSYAPL